MKNRFYPSESFKAQFKHRSFHVPNLISNRPFPSSKKSHFQNEAKCETFVVKMSFICIIIKTHFHNKGFALSLALKVRFFGTRKWPIRSTQMTQVRRLIQTSNLISRTQFIFTMFNGLKCLQVKTNFSNLCIRFGTREVRRLKRSRSTVEIPLWATRS